ncbi:hypothetical protein [uncultured Tolumonas sp.]|uniref:transglycosylase SLT domain-containing protein n=1 Tax=uncultured Tolumonas sp. TaxID=263765 RepID=UPI00292D6603|nr:hypothetical protein [uncultured Tolumonas sp.]
MLLRSLFLLMLFLLSACSSTTTNRPDNPENICDIFRQNSDWYDAAKNMQARWKVPLTVPMAMMYQESSFKHDAKPPMDYFLFIPLGRRSSAYGYAQVKDEVWEDYKNQTGNSWADRDDFADAIDFMGWYSYKTSRVNKIAPSDAYNQYLNYHEGWGGFRRGTQNDKRWLLKTSRVVEARAKRYATQFKQCRSSL